MFLNPKPKQSWCWRFSPCTKHDHHTCNSCLAFVQSGQLEDEWVIVKRWCRRWKWWVERKHINFDIVVVQWLQLVWRMWCNGHCFQTVYYGFKALTLNLIQIWKHILHRVHIWNQGWQWARNIHVRTHKQTHILIKRVIEINKGWWREMWRWNQLFLLQNKNFGNHICHKCSYPWGEDRTLIILFQTITNNLIPPWLDIPMDPIRIWYWTLGILNFWQHYCEGNHHLWRHE